MHAPMNTDREGDRKTNKCRHTYLHVDTYANSYSSCSNFCKTLFWGGCPTLLQAKELWDVLASAEASAELGAGELHHFVASAAQPEPASELGASEKWGPQYSTLNNRILIIRTPK